MKLEFSGRSLIKYSNIKFHENPSSGSRVVSCGQTDGCKDGQTYIAKLIVAFRNFANSPKIIQLDVDQHKGLELIGLQKA